ncbi:MAG: carbamoyl-phosphate synthase domain-containing protein, partial [Bacteriovoracaceae bacterium]
MKLQLILENGKRFIGDSFGHELKNNFELAEIVFNTAMTGYQEIISDPSYCDQFITLTYPLIGNYGICKDDFESLIPYSKGLIVHDICEDPSNYRSDNTLSSYLKKHKIPAISGIDTRELTRIIRDSGVLKAIIAPLDYPEHNLEIIFKSP